MIQFSHLELFLKITLYNYHSIARRRKKNFNHEFHLPFVYNIFLSREIKFTKEEEEKDCNKTRCIHEDELN